MEEEICKHEVNDNLMRVQAGLELTLPLATLNRNCEFRKKYEELNKIRISHNCKNCNILFFGRKMFCCNKCHKAYYQRPEIKAHQKAHWKAYNQRPEVKAHRKAYNQRPEIKAYQKAHKKAYYQRPEIKAHRKAYNQRPEIKARQKAYYQKIKWRNRK